jgi:copper transport protein
MSTTTKTTLVRITLSVLVATTSLVLAGTAAQAIPVHGEHVTQAARATQVASDGEMRLLRDVLAVDRTIGYLAMATLIGGWVFLAVIWPAGAAVRRTRQVLTVAWLLGFLATVAGMGLQGATESRSGFGGVIDTEALSDALETDPGRAWASRAMMLLLALPLLVALARDTAHAARAVWWRVGALVVAAGLVRTRGFVGHSTDTAHSALGAVANFVHIAAIATWIGGLVLLAFVVLPRRDPAELADVVPRYSTIAKYTVGAIVLAGAVLTWVVLGALDDLFDTHYGRVLLLKLVIFAAVMVVAWFSKRWVDARLKLAVVLEGDAATVKPFVVSVAAEVALAVALMAVSAVLVGASPGS